MEGKLIKTGDQFLLRNKEDEVIAITSGTMEGRMLSLKNCQAIELGYDLDGLALSYVSDHLTKGTDEYRNSQVDFKEGFQKALEILGNKKFSEEDVLDAWEDGTTNNHPLTKSKKENLLKSLHQTEWDVEIVMEQYVKYVPKSFETIFPTGGVRPKLDADGCLILKRK